MALEHTTLQMGLFTKGSGLTERSRGKELTPGTTDDLILGNGSITKNMEKGSLPGQMEKSIQATISTITDRGREHIAGVMGCLMKGNGEKIRGKAKGN